jgi:biotin-dependent carboxylase-like uncharacterized protein
MSYALEVLSGGALATVQDDGRPGALRHGVPRGGAMDRFAALAANRLVGNPPGAAVVEVTAGGAAFAVLRPTLLAVAGAALGVSLDDEPLPLWTTVLARAGTVLALPRREHGWGARAYLAIGGGIAASLVLGSRATHLPGHFGGVAGRPLRPGDMLASEGPGGDPLVIAGRTWPEGARPPYGPVPTLRFVPGPHTAHFAPGALEAVAGATLRVSDSSNRMGYRLEGARASYVGPTSIASLGVIPGVIQVPPNGAPILLMADAQTTGGYPVLGVVLAPDLPLAAQLLPGDHLHLAPVELEEALAARQDYAAWCALTLPNDEELLQLGLTGAGPLFTAEARRP